MLELLTNYSAPNKFLPMIQQMRSFSDANMVTFPLRSSIVTQAMEVGLNVQKVKTCLIINQGKTMIYLFTLAKKPLS